MRCGATSEGSVSLVWCGAVGKGWAAAALYMWKRVRVWAVARVECQAKSERSCEACALCRAMELVVQPQVLDRKSRRSHGEGKKQQPCWTSSESWESSAWIGSAVPAASRRPRDQWCAAAKFEPATSVQPSEGAMV